MKTTRRSGSVKARVKTNTAKKIAAIFGLMLTFAAVGAVAIYGSSKNGSEIKADDGKYAVTTAVQAEEDAGADEEIDVELSETVTWRKAGIEDYDFAEVTTQKTTTAKTEEKKTKAGSKSSTKKTTVEEVKGLRVYASAAVYVRDGADTSCESIGVLNPETEVEVTGKTTDGWYRIKYGGKTGYVCAKYFTEDKDAAVTNAEADETKSGVISYTDEEFEMLCYVLQHEVGYCSQESKIAVANVIINRVKDGSFGSSITEVLTAPNQFTAINNYYSKGMPPTEDTIECARRALNGEDNSNGAVYYYAPQYCGGATAEWFETLTFCLELDGQRYFK